MTACKWYHAPFPFTIPLNIRGRTTQRRTVYVSIACQLYVSLFPALQSKVLLHVRTNVALLSSPNREGETVLGWLLKSLLVGGMSAKAVEGWIDELQGK